MASHKQTMGDNEKLLADLQKANETIQVWHRRMLPCLGFSTLGVIGVISQRLTSTCIPAQFFKFDSFFTHTSNICHYDLGVECMRMCVCVFLPLPPSLSDLGVEHVRARVCLFFSPSPLSFSCLFLYFSLHLYLCLLFVCDGCMHL